MSTSTIPTPIDWVQSLSELRLPSRADQRLQELMHRNTEGQLTPTEHSELETLVELSQEMSLVRARALQVLGKGPL